MRDIVVIGTSAGGVPALQRVIASLPASFPAALIVVLHMPAWPSKIVEIIARAAHMPVAWATDQLKVCAGNLYLAPPDHQLTIEMGMLRVDKSPKEGQHRPSINVLFRSAAAVYRNRVIGVILTGALNDGTAGLWEVKRRGGVAVVQDPADAAFSQMPSSAILNVPVDFVLPLSQIAEKLIELTCEDVELPSPVA